MIGSCPGCAITLLPADGPVHPYLTASPGCWARYGQLLAAQYSDPRRMRFHQLVVDSYAVQHPDGDDPRAIQSVAIHLMTLGLFVEGDVDPAEGPSLHRKMVRRPHFHKLAPPPHRGELTVLDVPLTGPVPVAREAACAWAATVWTAWQNHHATVRAWLAESGLSRS